MIGRSEVVVFIFLRILTLDVTEKVQGFIDEALNPVKDISNVWQRRSLRLAVRLDDDSCGKNNVYVCEEPEEIVSPDVLKTCNYRNQRYQEQVYRWVAGRGCLLYTPDSLFVGGANTINLNAGCFYGDWFAPCLEMVKDDGTCGCYPFDPGLEAVAVAVRDVLLPVAHTRWERCFYAAQQCCSHLMHENDNSDQSHCETTFDGWTCWSSAEAGAVATEVCSEFAYTGQGPSCDHYSSKRCQENGTWEMRTDYSSCSRSPHLLRRYRFYIAMLSLSIASCLPAIFMFVFYKRLRITIMAIHSNLLIAIIVKNAIVIFNRVKIHIDELTSEEQTVISTHVAWCRLLAATERGATNTVFLCLLVEGIYLHSTVVADRTLNLKWIYGIGAVLVSITPVAAWAMIMAFYDDHSCWLVYTTRQIQWMLDGPRLIMLLITTALIIHVLRVMLSKEENVHNIYLLKTAKATLSLMPVFASQFLVTALQPTITSNCIWEQIYYYAAWSIEALQGFLVATLYCYVNKEVHALVKSTYNKTKARVGSRERQKSNNFKQHFDSNGVSPYSIGLPIIRDDKKDDHSTIKSKLSKLQVAEIISIHATERVGIMKEPFYETIENGIHNEGYDSLDRSEANSSVLERKRHNEEEYYGFTNVSSVSIECQDWIRCMSSNSNSVCDYYISEFDATSIYPFQYQTRKQEIQSKSITFGSESTDVPQKLARKEQNIEGSDYEYCDNDENMLQEIIEYMESNTSSTPLDPDPSPPNRSNKPQNKK